MDEIPVAKREKKPQKKKKARISNNIILIFVASLVVVLTSWFLSQNYQTQSLNQSDSNSTITENSTDNENSQQSVFESTNNESTIESEKEIPENILGHLPYIQAPENDLKAITNDGSIRLRSEAATKFLQMQRDAKRQGITLVPLSGFRTISEQEVLFFEIKEQRQQDASQRAEVSAPPGYSEHHTGYAIDIGDVNFPDTHLETSFEKTEAYRWLIKNAPKYSFELSFPPDNLQGISYEPWHWRFVGDTDSLETFYKVQNLKTNLKPKR